MPDTNSLHGWLMTLSPREPQSTKQGTANPAIADQTGDVANAYSGMVASTPVVRAFGVIERYRDIEWDGLAQYHHLAYDITYERRRNRKRRRAPDLSACMRRPHSSPLGSASRTFEGEHGLDPFPLIRVFRCTAKRVAMNVKRAVRRRKPLSAGGQMASKIQIRLSRPCFT